jgi:SNF2 family DNA or RNA helicase
MKYKPHPYQDHATEHIIENPFSGLFLDMGLGKTVATLTGVDRLMFDMMEVSKPLIIAPLRVARETWTTEASKWDHLRHFRIAKVIGDEKQRKTALLEKADIWIINRENIPWLIAHYGSGFPFDMLIIDELSSFKDPSSKRFKALRKIRPLVKRVVGLTGTPAPNSLLDLWPQLYLLDQGERLGKFITGYREKYFKATHQNGHVVYKYELHQPNKADAEILGKDIYVKEIYDKISDICISMKAEDYLRLPERIDNDILITLPGKVQKKYDEFERDQVLQLAEEEEISAVNAAVLTGKLLQYANGAIYDEEKNWHEIHNEKIAALEEIMEEAMGQPVLIFYNFKHDKERILKHFKSYKPEEINIKKWNRGEIQMMYAHPASAGHGLNLQAGGNIIVWFGMPWSLELYMQAVARLHRQGQTRPVMNHRIIVKGTMDEDVIKALDRKAGGQEALMQAVKARMNKYLKTA